MPRQAAPDLRTHACFLIPTEYWQRRDRIVVSSKDSSLKAQFVSFKGFLKYQKCSFCLKHFDTLLSRLLSRVRHGHRTNNNRIGHFVVPPGLCFKTRVGAQPLIWKSFFILMQIKLIFTRKFVHLASFWKWGFLELGSGLFRSERKWKVKTQVNPLMLAKFSAAPSSLGTMAGVFEFW